MTWQEIELMEKQLKKPAPYRTALCERHIGKDGPSDEGHRVPVTMKPVKTLRRLLVHPKDKQEKEEITDCVYKIPCGNWDKTYIGETGRKFGIRLKEHKTEGEAATNKPFITRQHLSSLSEQNKSALTDHASHDNHVINWPTSTILDRESDRSTRWIKDCLLYTSDAADE